MDELEIYRHAFRVLAERDLEGAARAAIEALVAATGADRGLLALVPARREGDAAAAAAALREPFEPFVVHAARPARDLAQPPSGAIIGRALSEGRPVRVENAVEHPDFRGRPSVLALSVLSVLAVPIDDGRGPVAVAYLDSTRLAGIFTAAAESAAERLARAMAPAIARAREVRDASLRAEAFAAERAAREQDALIGRSPAFVEAIDLARQVAPSDVVVLLAGESGTGKELFARAIHAHSRRAEGPFVAINCAALPGGTVEAELFGHARGAFTGAVHDRAGLVEAAAGGTLFLDEVGDLPLALQAKLLRVLQDGEVRRLGATTSRRVDVRVVAATHRDLAARVREGAFREDLYYRLRGVEVRIPALRERREDILLLAAVLLRRFAAIEGLPVTGFAPSASDALLAHAYPGNVRELENAIRSAVLLARGPRIARRDLPAAFAAPPARRPQPTGRTGGSAEGFAGEVGHAGHAGQGGHAGEAGNAGEASLGRPRDAAELKRAKESAVKRLERIFLADLLSRTGGNVSQAAAAAGMHRAVLHELMARHGVEAAAFRRPVRRRRSRRV